MRVSQMLPAASVLGGEYYLVLPIELSTCL